MINLNNISSSKIKGVGPIKKLELEVEKIKEKRKASALSYTNEQRTIVIIGRYTMGILTIFFIGFAVCIFIWKNPIL